MSTATFWGIVGAHVLGGLEVAGVGAVVLVGGGGLLLLAVGVEERSRSSFLAS